MPNPLPACSKCGSPRLVDGKVGDGGFRGVSFKPEVLRKFFSIDGTVKIQATACLDCGAVDMKVDPVKLADMAG